VPIFLTPDTMRRLVPEPRPVDVPQGV